MNSTGIKMGIALLTGVGIGMLACVWRHKQLAGECADVDIAGDTSPATEGKTYTSSTAPVYRQITDKRAVSLSEQAAQLARNAEKKNSPASIQARFSAKRGQATNRQDQEDRTRWGTIQGLIEVADTLSLRQQKKHTTISQDKQQWGTRQGLVEVANELQEKKRRKQAFSQMQASAALLPELLPSLSPKEKPQAVSTEEWYNWLNRSFERTQVSITNTSTQEKTIHLWGTQSLASTSPPAPEDVEDHAIKSSVAVPVATGAAVHPQGVVVNPVNGFAYVANQLSNNVSVIASDGQLVRLIQLQPASLPGLNSPVALAVNSDPASAHYGKVYVAGSVADTVSVIDLDYQVTREIAVGSRPVALAFNPLNNRLYVANLAGNDVSVIDTENETLVLTIPVGPGPVGVGIHPVNGDVYIANAQGNSVSVINQSHVIATIPATGVNPVSFAYHPLHDKMYLAVNGSNYVVPIDPVLHSMEAPIAVGFRPYGIIYNPNNNFLYVGNIKDQTYTVIAPDHSIRDTIQVGPLNIGLAIDTAKNLIYSTDTPTGQVNIIGYKDQSSSVQLDADYLQKAGLFQHSPALIKHVKFVLSGSERFRVLTLKERTITGKETYTPISFSSYESPQNFLNVSEVFALERSILNGMNSWIFQIAAGQTITILLYYRQLDTGELLHTDSQTHKLQSYEPIT